MSRVINVKLPNGRFQLHHKKDGTAYAAIQGNILTMTDFVVTEAGGPRQLRRMARACEKMAAELEGLTP